MRAFVGFAGFGGVDIALREFGFDVLGVEIDDDIAQVNRDNGGNVITADILTLNPDDYTGYDLAHFSPPCPNFSQAKVNGEETEQDLALAEWIARFVVVVQPQYFTLENVWAYRGSKSWSIICKALTGMGYGLDWWHLNAADYGIPQTRKRMIAIARWDGTPPMKPRPTHRDASKHNGQLGLFDQLPSWVGWYQAIADLIPDLPDSQFADWQLKRMPDQLRTFLMAVNGEHSTGIEKFSPAMTIMAGHTANKYRAFICDFQNTGRPLTIRRDDEPMFTTCANTFEKGSPQKAFIIGGHYQDPSSKNNRIVQNRPGDRPNWTITASENGDTRSYVGGRIVSMTPRCLARFQDFPDWFDLPENRILACRGIGNAVPPGLYRAILRSLCETNI